MNKFEIRIKQLEAEIEKDCELLKHEKQQLFDKFKKAKSSLFPLGLLGAGLSLGYLILPGKGKQNTKRSIKYVFLKVMPLFKNVKKFTSVFYAGKFFLKQLKSIKKPTNA